MRRQGLGPSRDLRVGLVQGVAPEHSVPWDAVKPIGAGLRAVVNNRGERLTTSR